MVQILVEQVLSKFLLVQQVKEMLPQLLVILDTTAPLESLKAILTNGVRLVEVL